MQPDGTITHLPLPNLNNITRQQVLDYFENCWAITEILFSGLQGDASSASDARRIA
jgi:L-lysine 2,3-aminomutase